MRVPKALLPFGPELMLQRVVRLLSEVVEPIVVVAAEGQRLPKLPAEIMVTRDEREGRGPLEGLRAGLTALASRIDAAYATSCDSPLISQAFVRRMIAALGEHDAAVPADGEFYHPLSAIYQTRTTATIEQLLDQEEHRMSALLARLLISRVSMEELRGVDPELSTLMNVNTPTDYTKAIELAGVSPDSSLKSPFGQ